MKNELNEQQENDQDKDNKDEEGVSMENDFEEDF